MTFFLCLLVQLLWSWAGAEQDCPIEGCPVNVNSMLQASQAKQNQIGSHQETQQGPYNKYNHLKSGGACDESDPLSRTTASTLEACWADCSNSATCNFISYKHATSRCRMYDTCSSQNGWGKWVTYEKAPYNYNLVKSGGACDESDHLSKTTASTLSACRADCSNSATCNFISYKHEASSCRMYDSCSSQNDWGKWVTYKKAEGLYGECPTGYACRWESYEITDAAECRTAYQALHGQDATITIVSAKGYNPRGCIWKIDSWGHIAYSGLVMHNKTAENFGSRDVNIDACTDIAGTRVCVSSVGVRMTEMDHLKAICRYNASDATPCGNGNGGSRRRDSLIQPTFGTPGGFDSTGNNVAFETLSATTTTNTQA